MDNNPEGVLNAGDTEKITLTKEEYNRMVENIATGKQAQTNMKDEITNLREKVRTLSTSDVPNQIEDVSKLIDAEFKKREQVQIQQNIDSATTEFLNEHPEFSKDEDPDGSKLKAFQVSLSQFSLSGVKTKEDYVRVLENAMRLTPEVAQPVSPLASTPRTPAFVNGKLGNKFSDVESKLIQQNFGGDVERYLKVKTKRPDYIEELLKYVR